MSDEMKQPFVSFKSGELITAEGFNGLQVLIKDYINKLIAHIKEELDVFKSKPVDAAKFGGKTPQEWTKANDERYVQRSELKNGWGEYRRYFKQIAAPATYPILIEHNLGRYPMVNVFELTQLLSAGKENLLSEDTNIEAKFVVYYAGRRDLIADEFKSQGSDNIFWGDKLEFILDQLGMSVTPTQYFDDVLNDLWGKMFDPGLDQDNFRRKAYGHSRYIQNELLGKNRTVEDLKKGGLWDDLRVAIKPKMIPVSLEARNANGGKTLEVSHLSQNTLEIDSKGQAMDLMVLLRT